MVGEFPLAPEVVRVDSGGPGAAGWRFEETHITSGRPWRSDVIITVQFIVG